MTDLFLLVCILLGGAGMPAPSTPSGAADVQTARAELEARYAELAEANGQRDISRIRSMRHETFHSVLPDGTVSGPAQMDEYSRQFFAANQPPIIGKFTIRQFSLSGDGLVAVADVFQEVTRFREIDGQRRKVETSVVQRETWFKTAQGWRLARVDNLRDQTRRVEGGVDGTAAAPSADTAALDRARGQPGRLQGPAMRTELLPRAIEIELALSAAPAHLRSGATVHVFGRDGYTVGRAGNTFTCLVNRDAFLDGYDALKPTCFDPEGTARIVPMLLREGELIAKGVDPAVIRAEIEAAFERGELQAPARPGIAYMLQGDVSAINPATGEILARSHPPHLMFYAPGLTNADFGFGPSAIDGLDSPPFVYRRNRHHGYVIVTPRR